MVIGEGTTLKSLYSSAKHRHEELDLLDPRSDAYKQNLSEAIAELNECRTLVSQNALFSVNEDMDDVSTQDIQYLGVDYLLADLLLKSYGEDRQQTLGGARQLLDNFLTTLDQYDILSASDKKLFTQFQGSRKSFTLALSTNFEERRKLKVARFQEEKALKQKLEYLRNKSKENAVDDETLRSLYLAEIALFASQTFQSLDMITQESEILSHARLASQQQSAMNGNSAEQSSRSTDGYSEKLDSSLPRAGLGRPGGPLLSKTGKPLQPFTLTDKRTQLRQGVFRSGHNLPSMSIEDYLEEEKRRGGILDSSGSSNALPAEPDEDNMALADAETMKAREWDEFVEANPKGAGNTLNRG